MPVTAVHTFSATDRKHALLSEFTRNGCSAIATAIEVSISSSSSMRTNHPRSLKAFSKHTWLEKFTSIEFCLGLEEKCDASLDRSHLVFCLRRACGTLLRCDILCAVPKTKMLYFCCFALVISMEEQPSYRNQMFLSRFGPVRTIYFWSSLDGLRENDSPGTVII
jgi:hypothetical protein